MPNAIQIHNHGGPEVLKYEPIELHALSANDVLIYHTAMGVNFIDTYHRSGLYKIDLPFIPGTEGAGIIEEIGSAVDNFKVGDRVVYAAPSGGYAEKRIMPSNRVIKLPEDISNEIASASMIKGLTAEYLLNRTYQVKPGQTILVHAAAGGVGSILCQWAKHLEANIIGTVSNEEKAKIALNNGCTHTILYTKEDIVKRVNDITNGKGVDVVYDSVGASTFSASLDCLCPRGMFVSYGNASGPVPEFSPLLLTQKGSLYLTRPSLWHYISNETEYKNATNALFEVIRNRKVKIAVNQRYNLKDAARAHIDLEARLTTGSSILIP